jgi:cytochrome c oxidase subunit 2
MESKLIIILIVVIGAIAISQLVRVYELTAKLRKHEEHEIPMRDNYLNAKLMLLFMGIQFGGFIYLMLKYGWTGRGPAASIQGESTDWLLNLNLLLVSAIFFLTNFLLFYFSFKYVKRPGVKAYYYPHNNKLEMLWTVVPAAVLAVVIILGLQTWNDVTGASPKDAISLELYSKQFDWTARYSGGDNTLGRTDYKLITGTNELGLMTAATIDSSIHAMRHGAGGILDIQKTLNNRDTVLTDSLVNVLRKDLGTKERLLRLLNQMKATHNVALDKHVYDDIIQRDTLYLCVNKPYEISFRSKDVIHSAYFPHFRTQMNTVPGYGTRMKFTPNKTTAEMRTIKNLPTFHYVLMCNKICGGAHYKMKLMVVVLEEAEYNAWMKGKGTKTFKNTYFPAPAAPATNPVADTVKTAMN